MVFLLDAGVHRLHGSYDFTVNADLDGADDTIVSSKQKYREIKSQGTNLHTQLGYRFREGHTLLVDIEVYDSSIEDGAFNETRSSDAGNDTSTVASRRSGNAGRDVIETGQASLVYRDSLTDAPSIHFSWHLGYAQHEQTFVLSSANQLASASGNPAVGPIDNYRAQIDAEWSGPWLGVELSERRGAHTLLLRYQHYESIDYTAQGDWSLVDSLQHPVSFKQHADAEAGTFRLEYRYAFTDFVHLGTTYNWNRFIAEEGDYRLYRTDNSISAAELDEVNWNFYTLSLDLIVTF